MARMLFKEQLEVAEFGLDKQTGQLESHLRQAPFEVIESPEEVRLELI